jgi:hypothetical protein
MLLSCIGRRHVHRIHHGHKLSDREIAALGRECNIAYFTMCQDTLDAEVYQEIHAAT